MLPQVAPTFSQNAYASVYFTIDMFNMSIPTQRYTPGYLAVPLWSSILKSMYIFIVLKALWLLPTLRTRNFEFLTIIINLFTFSQFVILSSDV